MRVLHTSDWHIGQRLYNRERDDEFSLFFDWLIQKIQELQVDVLIVAGDIFDIAYPSNRALQLYYQTLTRLINTTCRYVIVTGGNHDSVSTLNAPKEILEALNIYVTGGMPDSPTDEVIELQNTENTTELVICAVPFLRDRDIRQSTPGETYEDRIAATGKGIINHYDEVAKSINECKQKGIPVIATGHLYLANSRLSGSERDIHIGNLSGVQASQFPAVFDYVALGHIHHFQTIENNRIYYSGSPLPLSFAERRDTKKLLLIDINEKEKIITPVDVPVFRNLISISGTFSKVREKLNTHEQKTQLKDWIEIEVEEDHYDPVIDSALEQLVTQKNDAEILKYKATYKDKITGADHLFAPSITLEDLDAVDVFEKLLEKEQIFNNDELKLSFNELVENILEQ